MDKKKKLIFSKEALDAIAANVKIDYEKIIQGVLKAIPKPKDGKDLILTETMRSDFADQIATLLPQPKDGKDGKPGLSYQEKEQIRADITEKVQADVKIPDMDEVTKTLADTFVTKGLLKDRMDAITRFIKKKTPASAGISGEDMVAEIDRALGKDWQSGGGVAWGGITGTLADQTDLKNALAAKMTGPGSSQINQLFSAVDTSGNAKMTSAKIDGAGKLTGINDFYQGGDHFILTGKHIYFSTDIASPTALTLRSELTTQSDGDIFLQSWLGGLMTVLVSIDGTTKAITMNGLIVSGKPLFINTIKSGNTQGGAGAAANEIWKTSVHATLPDNTLMIGV